MMQRRQTARGANGIDRDSSATEKPRLAGRNFGGGYQQLDRALGAQLVKVDRLQEQAAQRIEAEGIEVVRRPQARDLRHRRRSRQAVEERIEPQKIRHAGLVNGLPDAPQIVRARPLGCRQRGPPRPPQR